MSSCEALIEKLNIGMTTDQYIDHEVRLRVQKEMADERFMVVDKQFARLEAKMNWIISLVVGGWMLPIVLHFLWRA